MIDLPFWDIFKEKDVDRASREHREATVAALEAGDIPPYARRRIESQVASGSKFFSSTFSAKEYLLAREGRYLPISQVMGSAFIKMAWSPAPDEEIPSFVNTGELTSLTLAHEQACDLALERLQKEAALLGADGVIGVLVKRAEVAWAENVTEFTAVGTAVRIPGCVKPVNKQSRALPFTSTLSGQEFWQLYESGYWPAGIVMGNSSYYVRGHCRTNSLIDTYGSINQELSYFSDGFSRARELAVSRLTSDIVELGAEGAVDMDVSHSIRLCRSELDEMKTLDILITFVLLGTAVLRRPDGKARAMPTTRMVIDLSKSGIKNIDFDAPIDELAGGRGSEGFADDEALE